MGASSGLVWGRSWPRGSDRGRRPTRSTSTVELRDPYATVRPACLESPSGRLHSQAMSFFRRRMSRAPLLVVALACAAACGQLAGVDDEIGTGHPGGSSGPPTP